MTTDNDLTLEDQMTLAGLKNPDNVKTDHYQWDEELQREIVGLICNDDQFLKQSLGLVKPSYFANTCHQSLAKIVFSYYEKYGVRPEKTQILHQLKACISDKDQEIRAFYLSEMNTVYEYYVPGIAHRKFYVDKIVNFAKAMAMKIAFGKCLEEFKKSPESEATWIKVESLIKEALSVDRNVDIGLDYFESPEIRYARMQKKRETGDYFITNFKTIDDSLACGGLSRGEIGSVMAMSGGGKSIFLVNAAIANMHCGKRILYVSLEIDQDKCAERFDAQLANPSPFGDESNGINTKNLYDHKDVVFDSLKSYVSDKDDRKLLIIKQFPAGELTLNGLRAYVSNLYQEGFKPDLVIIDYVGEMADYPGMPTWESRQKVVRDLRGFAVEQQVCILTAMQPDAKSKEAVKLGGIIDDDNLAESKGQNRPLDALWSINQLQDEKDCGLARIFVVKQRDGKSRFLIHVEFDYNTLKMREISESKYKTIYMKHKNEKTTSVAEQMSKLDQIMNTKKKEHIANFSTDVGYNDEHD